MRPPEQRFSQEVHRNAGPHPTLHLARSLAHSLIHSFIHSLICSFIQPFLTLGSRWTLIKHIQLLPTLRSFEIAE